MNNRHPATARTTDSPSIPSPATTSLGAADSNKAEGGLEELVALAVDVIQRMNSDDRLDESDVALV